MILSWLPVMSGATLAHINERAREYSTLSIAGCVSAVRSNTATTLLSGA